MSTPDYDLDDELDEQDNDQSKGNWRRDLERKARKADENARLAQTAQRELAFYKAGLPMSDPRMTYFVKGYEGPNDSDAIRKAAQEAGFMAPAEQDTTVADEVAQHQQIADASAGASVAGKLTPSDVLGMAAKAADAAPQHLKAQAYQQVLAEHGLGRMRRAPEQ